MTHIAQNNLENNTTSIAQNNLGNRTTNIARNNLENSTTNIAQNNLLLVCMQFIAVVLHFIVFMNLHYQMTVTYWGFTPCSFAFLCKNPNNYYRETPQSHPRFVF